MVHLKKLVFHFYAGEDWEKSPIYCLHKYFLTKYSGIFDSAEFYIAVNDLNDKVTIESVEHFLIGCGFKDVRFFVQKNNWLYCGGFYWIDCPELLSRFGKEIPYPYDRFYGENLPGNLCKHYDYEAYSHNYMIIPSWEFDRVGATYDSVYGRVKCILKDEEMELFDLEIKKATQVFNDYILKFEMV